MKSNVKNNFFKASFVLALLAIVLSSLLFCRLGITANAAEPKSVNLLANNSSDMNYESTQGVEDILNVSPSGDGISYVSRTQMEFVLNEGVDVSGFDRAKLALDFWVFSEKPQETFTGDNQIEVSSNVSGHDSNEYNWAASDVFYNKDYVVGKWNHAVLHFNAPVGAVTLSSLNWFRIYYLYGANSYPILISNVKIIETDLTGSNIIETIDSPSAVFGGVEMPTSVKEGDSITLNLPEVTDITGELIPSEKITVETIGPNGFKAQGRTVTLDDGAGEYEVVYTATDALGKKATLSKKFTVTELPSDTILPKIIVLDGMPKDFMTGKTFAMNTYINVSDNKGKENLDVVLKLLDPAGVVAGEYTGKASELAFSFAPTLKGEYSLQIKATDASKNSSEREIKLLTYNPAQSDKKVDLFAFDSGEVELLNGGYYSGRIVEGRPVAGKGKSVEFDYIGGATNTTDNEAYRQEFALINNNPADLSGIDMRWAALKMWIYIDKQYANDNSWMPSNGTGYGNMGLGIASRAGIFNVARMEYPVNDMRLKKGWNEITIKLGREFGGKMDLTSISELYLYTNFGATRKMLFNDICIVESDKFPEGILPVNQTTSAIEYYFSGAREQVEKSTVEVDNSGEYVLKETYYQGSPSIIPGLKVTDHLGGIDYVANPFISITDSEGMVYESKYFTPEVTGEHKIIFTCKDYFGQELYVEKTFNVEPPNKMPSITIADYEDLRFKKGEAVKLPAITGADEEGETVTLVITVYKPNGEVLNAVDGKYIPDMTGKYKVKVVATDAVGQWVKKEITFTVFTETTSIYTPEKLSVAGIMGIVFACVGGAVVLAGAAVVTILVLKNNKAKKAIKSAAEATTSAVDTTTGSNDDADKTE